MDEARPTADLAVLEAELDMHNAIEGRCDCGDHEWPGETFNRHVAASLSHVLALRAAARPADGEGLRAVIVDINSRIAKLNPGSDGLSTAKRRQVIKWATVHLTAIRDQVAALAAKPSQAARPAVGEEGLREALDYAMALGHNLAVSGTGGLGHSGERYQDCPQPLCRRVTAILAARPAAGEEGLDVARLPRAYENTEATIRASRHSGRPFWTVFAEQYAALAADEP